jgi:hypothetical protein
MATTNELVAAERGYPGTLLGFTPNDRAYWREPGLLPIAYLPNEAIEGPTDEFIFVTDRMAPRFPDGTVVGLEPVASRQDLVVGRVYVQLVNNAGEYPVGRLARVGRTSLELTQDNHSATLTWSLGAEEQTEMQDLYEVTCYSLYLPHDEARLPESPVNDARPLLLEIATDAMAPRYPLGSRYFIRPVPPDQWAQARGVHALVLTNGTWAVRRLAASASANVLVLESDRTGDIVLLATREVVSVWKLGVCDYMPEESEADHHWAIQQSINWPTPNRAPA